MEWETYVKIILKYDNNFFTMNLPVYKSLVATIFLRLKLMPKMFNANLVTLLKIAENATP